MSKLIIETRECKGCKHFTKDPFANTIGTCRRHLMVVIEEMKVTFKESEGTCFEQKIYNTIKQ